MKRFAAWIKVSRLPSQSYIFCPILFGQACYFLQSGRLDLNILVLMQLFGLFDQLYIVYANDYADIEVDRRNTDFNIFSGGSRVLVDGDLRPAQLKYAAFLMAGLCLACGIILTYFYHRWLAVPIIVIALGLLWMYSYPPVKLSYRGGGEFLQMPGVGLVLPVFGYYAQSGQITGFPWPLLLAVLPTQLACAMGTSLADEPSDREGGKRTLPVILGQRTTKYVIIALNFMSIGILPLVIGFDPADIRSLSVIAVPLSANTLHFFFIKAEPGTISLTILNLLTVLVTVSIMCGLATAFFLA